MFEVQMLIPVVSNEGDVFTAEHHAAFEARVIDACGGFTLYPSTAVGGWRNDTGQEFRDRTRVYGMAIRSLADGAGVAALGNFAKAHYCQEAIFIRYLGQVEII
jgi:hypothetical protein